MSTEFITRFRGNIFFLLLLRAVNKDFGIESDIGKSANGLTRTALFSDLIRVLNPNYPPKGESSLDVYISKYLNGDQICSPKYYPFDSENFQEDVEERFRSHYDDALSAMNSLCYKYLDMPTQENKGKSIRRLVAGIVEVIMRDNSFDEDIYTGYGRVEKSVLETETKFLLQPFLLDVWYKIVTRYSGKVDVGKIDDEKQKMREWNDTYLNLTKDSGKNQPKTLRSEVGKTLAEKMTVEIMPRYAPDEQAIVWGSKQNPSLIEGQEEGLEGTTVMKYEDKRQACNNDEDDAEQQISFKQTKEGGIKIAKNMIEFNNKVENSTFSFS